MTSILRTGGPFRLPPPPVYTSGCSPHGGCDLLLVTIAPTEYGAKPTPWKDGMGLALKAPRLYARGACVLRVSATRAPPLDVRLRYARPDALNACAGASVLWGSAPMAPPLDVGPGVVLALKDPRFHASGAFFLWGSEPWAPLKAAAAVRRGFPRFLRAWIRACAFGLLG